MVEFDDVESMMRPIVPMTTIDQVSSLFDIIL